MSASAQCPRCRAENPPDSLFCTECGARIEAGCAACGAENPPGARFCHRCGERLAETPTGDATTSRPSPRSYTPKHLAEKILHGMSALEGERKQVTVLFADVKGSMDLAEQVDPEEWHRILNRFFEILTDGVHRFEGTVNQYTGDGIMALFGAPIAHEDHAQRACYAALHLSDAIRSYADQLRLERGLNFAVRMGLNSGEVVVGKIGDDLRMDYTAQGYTVGLAARMEQIAEPGKVYVSHYTRQLVEGFFQLRDLGRSKLGGADEPVQVYELQGVGELRTRLEAAQARGFSKFVGRDREMVTLQSALEQAIEGNGQVVGVVGEAGVGKSRLCLEFLERCRAKGITVHEAHCPAHGKTVPFLPLLELLRNVFDVSEQDGEQTVREKITGRLLLLDRSFEETLPLVFDFLGVPDPERPAATVSAESRQLQLFAFVRQLVKARSAREPAVTLVDDLHWIDPGSDAFLAQLVEAARGTRTLLLVNFRPEYHADWMSNSYYQQLPLLPIGPEAIDELLSDLLGTDPSLESLPERIRERTGGNPFFIEEVVESLVEGGSLEGTPGAYLLARPVEELTIPATVQAVLAARIDRLAEQEKQVLQMGAVIGRRFPAPLLERIVELPERDLAACLGTLRGAEFIYEETLYPEAEYAFKHPLTHEVAYSSQLAERRMRIHAAVARAIEELYAEKLDERAALLAHHFEEAGEAVQAAHWHQRAGRWAGSSYPAETDRHWEAVRALLREAPESSQRDELLKAACMFLLETSWRLGRSPEETRIVFEEGRLLAERTGDLASEARLLGAYGRTRCTAGAVREYLELVRKAEQLLPRIDDVPVRAYTWVCLSDAHNWAGEFARALSIADHALQRVPHDPKFGTDVLPFSAFGLLSLERAQALYQSGRLVKGVQELQRTLRIAAEASTPELACWAHYGISVASSYAGNAQRTLEHARRLLKSTQEVGSPPYLLGLDHTAFTLAHLTAGRWDEAAQSARARLAVRRGSGTELSGLGAALTNLALALLGTGEWAEARRMSEKAVDHLRHTRQSFEEARAHRARALVLLRSEGSEARREIEEALARADSLVQEKGGRALAPQIQEARAELARALEGEAAWQHELREAHRLFLEIGATGHAERLAKELGL